MTPPEEFLEEALPSLSVLSIHIDVEEHLIQTKTLICGLQAVQDIVQGLNDFHFDGQLSITVLVLPSEEGGYLANIVIGCLGLVSFGATAITIHESETFAIIMEEFIGEPYVHEEVTRNFSRAFRNSIGGFFLLENEKIRQLTHDSPKLDRAIKSKSNFMRQCIIDSDIRGIGFSREHDFKIPRKDFFRHISGATERVMPTDVLHVSGFVASPVTLEGEERQWAIRVTYAGQNKVKNPYVISAYLMDDDFATDLFKGKHPVREDPKPDAIEVEILVSQVTRDGKIVNKSMKQIKKVISFKGERLVGDDYEIGSASYFTPEQNDLFTQNRNNETD